MNNDIVINKRRIGRGHPTYVIAEMSANHNGDYDKAVAIIHAAKEAGADAVKLQTYTPDTITIDCRNGYFMIGEGTVWEGKNLYDLYGEAYTPWEWQPKLKKVANDLGMDLFSSPFDETSVEFLEKMDVPAYKIASFELVDIPLIRRVAQTGKPVIISTGMATEEEIDEAVKAARESGCEQLALLKCTSAYPASPEEMNLRTISHLAETFEVPTGLSDHTSGSDIAGAAVALGACIIEKHLTMSREDPGPDSSFSLEPDEFKGMVEAVRRVEKALGKVHYDVGERESASRGFRRSLFIVERVKKGDAFTLDNVRSIRPGYGLHPRHLEDVMGKEANQDAEAGTPLRWDLIHDGKNN